MATISTALKNNNDPSFSGLHQIQQSSRTQCIGNGSAQQLPYNSKYT